MGALQKDMRVAYPNFQGNWTRMAPSVEPVITRGGEASPGMGLGPSVS